MGEDIEAVDARFKIISENLRLAMCAAPELDMAFEPERADRSNSVTMIPTVLAESPESPQRRPQEVFDFTPYHLNVLRSDLAELRASLAASGSIARFSDEIEMLKQLVKKLQEDCLRAQEDRVSALLECAKLQKERNDVSRDAIEKIEALRKENRRLKLDLANLKHKQDKEVEKGNKNRVGKEGRPKERVRFADTCPEEPKAQQPSLDMEETRDPRLARPLARPPLNRCPPSWDLDNGPQEPSPARYSSPQI
ncbi:glycosyl hydrolase 1 family protein [Aspergillus tubingensis]|uniref:glycosyl hydrolase 1 family protein n=1 Tax=Aspergillus tubingensis TaxID=5068 RepID=UPI0015790B77|nr:glycosyl hydrolase 1 family protein [Aspergillus tubingensis]GFN13017.1 glycosyl hydrolase 1 family protein [Aspergillus tubingensis]